ncbi:MAG: hypothetical protein R2685_04970 [Candidatus Nitrosocosmicus sp.]|nr:hypothetical protein [Candidatus Nitrosocosmicus sp.]
MGNIAVLGGLLKRIGNYDGMNNFENRLILQKTVYLLQSFDLYIGYRFSWYIHGPYCTELTKDGYSLSEMEDDIQSVKFTDSNNEEKFYKFLEFIGDKKTNAQWLEIIASIHFLNDVYPEMSKEEILNIVVDKQPYFSMVECEGGWDYLEKWGLVQQ